MELHPRGRTSTPTATPIHGSPPLHTLKPLRRAAFYRLFALVYMCGLVALFFHHTQNLLHSKTLLSISLSFSLLFSDLILTFMWATTQASRMNPVRRREFPENVEQVVEKKEFPGLDVFICTADPYKEPPITVVNTVLSVLSYDYPAEKLSVYVSDDGGSSLTLFAFVEASKFAKHWLPFCRENDIVDRSPEEYFRASNHDWSYSSEVGKIKMMFESMKSKVENVVERGAVSDEYITTDEERLIFDKWTDGFTRHDHPAVIQVLLENGKDKDITDHSMPNLTYLSREKRRTSHHHFKAGALNALLRVSATMTNAPIVLTNDCDMYSNDPHTPRRALCYLLDPRMIDSQLGFIQFPQRFKGINKDDIYGCEHKHLFHINMIGMDGLRGPNFVGSGGFFFRRALFGGPSTFVSPEIPKLCPTHIVDKPIQSQEILALAHHVAGSNYENNTNWGSKMGFRYGSLVEDYHTGYKLHCEGWKSILCNPDRAAFYGDAPISLIDSLNQNKRWAIGLLEVAFSKYSPITYGARSMGPLTGPLMGLAYSQYGFWSIWSIPITTYAFLPQLALLNGVSILPKVSEPYWFFLYVFLCVGGYVQDLLDFILEGSTVHRWWSDQRIWIIRGLSSYLFGLIEFLSRHIVSSTLSFNVTSKVVDDEQSKRYDQGIFEFGVASPMFVPLVMAAMINFVAFVHGLVQVLRWRDMEGLVMQMFISGFVMLNCWPIYEAMVLRSDKGKMPTKVTATAAILAFALYASTSLIFKE
ncbi:cellulose synthase-like protein G3 [Tripterygium wilfordii]|uniref:cellulose synthase-like protein G3 n=1 Tax=Tripterygium wilfordii TaxID=458696 RepID=UPI0018F7EFC8|nr:cellulose synthase-like protein G3 [Tripterygium wilfordii]XP_038726101.1 cellulose synthase-like protein G3 [Tripterygium wilfordii]